jgi:hypothetical protein
MALKYNVEYKNVAEIGEKRINFKPWTTKNEKDYLIAVEAEDNINDNLLYEILVKPCLEDPDISLTKNEQKMLMIEIRKKSLGGSFPMRYSCKKCKNVNDIDVEFDKIIRFKPDTWQDVQVDDIKFIFGDIATPNLKKRLDTAETKVDKAFIEFLIHIKEIEIDGTLENSFTFDELKAFVEELPTHIFDEAYKKFQAMKSSLTFELKTYCMICNEENDIDFEYLPNFLWA